MSSIKITRIIRAVLFFGVIGFVTYVNLELSAIKKELNGEQLVDWYNGGDGYLIDDTSDLHLHETYYFEFNPLVIVLIVILATISMFCLIAPARVVSIFRR